MNVTREFEDFEACLKHVGVEVERCQGGHRRVVNGDDVRVDAVASGAGADATDDDVGGAVFAANVLGQLAGFHVDHVGFEFGFEAGNRGSAGFGFFGAEGEFGLFFAAWEGLHLAGFDGT